MSNILDFVSFVKAASFLSIRKAVANELAKQEEHARKNRGKVSNEEIEVLWQLRDFLEKFDHVVLRKIK